MGKSDFRLVHFDDVENLPIQTEGAVNVTMRKLLTKEHGVPNFALRMFHIEPGGNTPYHSHNWEHENYVLEGEGSLNYNNKEYKLEKGISIYIPVNEMHQFRSETGMTFLCLIPV